jgi:GTP-binding protein Era
MQGPRDRTFMRAGVASFVGRPNVGKSTLLNRLVGTKLAIVSDKPQTTRTRILGVRNYPAAQVVFLDTPGIHRPLHRMNVRMVDAAVDTMRAVDVLGVLVDASQFPKSGDRHVLDLLADVAVPIILILNKIDLVRRPILLPLIDRLRREAAFAEIVPVSAATGENIERLEAAVLAHLPEGEPLYPPDFLTDRSERFMVAEIVREQILRFTRAEIPFSTAVVIDRLDRTGGAGELVRLYCTVLVERESQKAIVVGRGGEMVRQIGTAARHQLERFFGAHVFLDLHVRVKHLWREDDRVLHDIGVA